MIAIIQRARQASGRVRQRFRLRSVEWEHSIIMLVWGTIVLLNPSVFQGPSFVAFVGGSRLWGWLMLAGGVGRILALGINGYMARPTALVRALGAVMGIVAFGAISFGLLFSWTWSTGLAPYPIIAVFGLFALSWSIFDVAIPDSHNDA